MTGLFFARTRMNLYLRQPIPAKGLPGPPIAVSHLQDISQLKSYFYVENGHKTDLM